MPAAAAEKTAKGKKAETKAKVQQPKKGEPKKGKAEGKAEEEEDPAIKALRDEFAAQRDSLSLITRPFATLPLFVAYVVEFLVEKVFWVLRQPAVWVLLVPAVSLWFALKHKLAPHLFEPPVCGVKDGAVLWQVELAIIESLWWLILGILSSIGFGTGLHSGLMFLFPHVMQVVSAAEGCHTTVGLVPWYQHPCKLDCSTTSGPKDDSMVTFLRLWALVTVPCMVWGIGTAIGEIPPYAVAKTARLSGSKDSEFQQELDDARSKTDPFSRMKIWTINFTEKNGFLGVFLLAAWPNAAFDMCGMCCGYLLMPFWTFFLATACGKGLVKVNLQAAFFVNLFGSTFFNVLAGGVDSFNGSLSAVLKRDFDLKGLLVKARSSLLQQFELQSRLHPQKLFNGQEGDLQLADVKKLYSKYEGGDTIAERVMQEWDKNGNGDITLAEVSEAASRTDGMVSLGSLDPGKGSSMMKTAWELFVVGLVCFFLVSIVNQLAKTKQAELDEARLEREIKALVKKEKNGSSKGHQPKEVKKAK